MIKRILKNKLYLFTILVILLLGMMSLRYSSYTISFHGITEEREFTVSSETGAEVKKIHVHPGKRVKQNELLIELYNPEIELQIHELSGVIAKLKAQETADQSLHKEEAENLRAEMSLKLTELDLAISSLKVKMSQNRMITGTLHKDSSKVSDGTPEIKALEDQRKLTEKWYTDRIQYLSKGIPAETPVHAELVQAEIQLKELLKQKEKLKFYSSSSGIIGSVLFKEGEKVSPFTPILTFYQEHPTYLRGYIYENDYDKISIGDEVEVVSLKNSRHKTKGIITGVGARIIEFPTRLKKRPEIPVWGRELTIRIDSTNTFLLGETVMVKAQVQESYLMSLIRK